jgi:multidrug resistance efflux pump
MEKVKALDNQVDALLQTQQFRLAQAKNKLQQARLKITADSMDFEAAKINFSVAQEQLKRMEDLYKQGLKSLTDLEARRLQLQKTQAELISLESKLMSSKNEWINAQIELSSIVTDYRDKISKAESDKFTALSNMYDAEAVVTKLQNQYMNYSIRNDMYYITAPQDGYITKAIQSGVGETIKEGEEIVSIMPSDYELAVEMYIKPVDLPLMKIGKKVRIQFDGWPAVIFSGWPNLSYGTFGGKVIAVDNFISSNGRYRLLIAQDPDDNPWPSPVRPGAGADNMALLNDVPIWYELWRQINGFPPDYYTLPEAKTTAK